ncbi:MAG: septation ring formation regulator EzrA [Absicoccus porci]|jgi:septation ring formation regulator|uniref:Negative regulator of septation ring formation n=2 Tax=Absicoccus porci TaxID=2486576 RepID=A0A3N0HYH3_9FIRM|nr:septation ring formation regulator EzrA [Absicoccus porci]MCI6088105.1 septation ring formation regulator EzrA [Absicoccus porci]MDD6459815.1 septation ring formation regulator EzrA [Absicoccus porci]MDD7329490.1 septation ring formation regulator EzrA [Absicoccus porci]MDY4739164.1 septation ring formation regulator EzrA [Absicoccus porci]MEE1355200.1 septation ring formation regulator EzrA [Absicoccus porci]
MQSVTDFLSFIQSRITLATLIYICIIVLVIILLVILSNHLRRRKANARFEELEKDVNAVRNNSLDYKFNKAKAFAKVNADIMERVNELTPKYNVCIEGMDECDTLCEKAHDALEGHHTKRAMRRMDELETSLKDARERIRIVTKALDNILQKETEVRDFANALKERYQNVRQVYTTNRNSFYKATTYFDSRFQEIENDFSNFEEWMYACEFNKAKDEGNKIAASIDSLSSEIALCPDLYERTKSIIPAAMMEINQNATELSQSDINLGYLEINKNLNEAASQLKEAEHRIDVGNLKEAQMMISQIGDGVLKLQDAISQEKAAYDEIHGGLEQNLITVSEIQVELNDIKKMYSNIRDRFGLEDWTHRFALADEQMGNVQEASTLLQREIKADQTPLIEVVRYYREFVADINEFKTQIDEMKSKLISASSDESRAQKQLIKLQLILNEVRLNAATRHLPSISSQFEKDIQQAEDLISRVQIVLSHSPLDVPTLNADLQDAIDFVYKLYNNANNLIGVAVMVENAIVFGNRFRSAHPSMNTDLTRAELCFQNGEYTRALKIAIQAIENLHPGTYEKLIAKKDPAVMNQV